MKESDPYSHHESPHETPDWAARYQYDEALVEKITRTLELFEELPPAEVIAQYHGSMDPAPDNVQPGEYPYDETEAMAVLPAHDLDRAKVIYSAFAESLDPRDRSSISIHMPDLCSVDHDTGVTLWEQLIRDPNEAVRRDAYRELEERSGLADEVPSHDPVEADRQVAAIGLSWRDVAWLSYAHRQAEEQPYRRHRLSSRDSSEHSG